MAGTIEFHRALTMLVRSVCPECSGPVEESLDVCEDHDSASGKRCSTCDTWIETRVTYVCSVCKHSGSYPTWAAAHDHPAVVAFYYDHGFEMAYGLDNPETCGQLWNHLAEKTQELVSIDPLRIRVTVAGPEKHLQLTLDENLTVIEETRSTP